jgi:hypothetical protein
VNAEEAERELRKVEQRDAGGRCEYAALAYP